MTDGDALKRVQAFWDDASCGESLYLKGNDKRAYDAHAAKRYELEPYIEGFAGFADTRGRKVLEIGVGLGADHERFAESGAILYGVDLTSRAIEHVRKRLSLAGHRSALQVGNAECLAFRDASFDRVYSWGVLHHTPDTAAAIREVHRVLKPGGEARVMVYHRRSIVLLMLWIRYALLSLRPFTSLARIAADHLESPGTKAYTVGEARQLFATFRHVRVETVLTHGDLLSSAAGQRHEGVALAIARRIWPRRLLRTCCPSRGLFLLVWAVK